MMVPMVVFMAISLLRASPDRKPFLRLSLGCVSLYFCGAVSAYFPSSTWNSSAAHAHQHGARVHNACSNDTRVEILTCEVGVGGAALLEAGRGKLLAAETRRLVRLLPVLVADSYEGECRESLR